MMDDDDRTSEEDSGEMPIRELENIVESVHINQVVSQAENNRERSVS